MSTAIIDQINAIMASKLVLGVKTASNLNWSSLKKAYTDSNWAELGALTIEDALEIAKPWVPQAGAAKAVVHLVASMVENVPKGTNQKFDFKQFIEAVSVAEGIDWKQLHTALMGNGPFLAGTLFADDLAKIVSPFVPAAAAAVPVLNALVFLGEHSKPAQVEDPAMKKVAPDSNPYDKGYSGPSVTS